MMHDALADADRARWDALRADLAARAVSPVEGLFGAGSVMWRVSREVALFLGGPAALLMQIAHPAVAAAVAAHSDFRRDPLGRGRRTFDAVYGVVFGSLERALGDAQRVFHRHESVRGDVAGHAYRANDPSLLLWVHATLIHAAMAVYDAVVEPLGDGERARYYEESLTLGEAFGVPREVQPPTLAAFRDYFDEMVDGPALAVGREALEERDALMRVPPSASIATALALRPTGRTARFATLLDRSPLRLAARGLNELLAAGFLPARLRRDFGYRWSPVERSAFAALIATARRTLRRVPPRHRYLPGYHRALARVWATNSPAPEASR